MLLITLDNIIDHSSLKQHYRNIIVAHKYNDILQLVETTQFSLILLDLTVGQPELITAIRAPLCINRQTPVIAIIDPNSTVQEQEQYLRKFNGFLTKPVTEEQLNEFTNTRKTKALAYIQIISSRTKNNPSLTLTLFKKLFEELPAQIADIGDALKNKRYDRAYEITHKLNGSASFCGLTDIQQPANTLENNLLNNNYVSIDRLFLELEQNTLNFVCHHKTILTHLEQG